MKKSWNDTLNGLLIEFTVVVTSNEKKAAVNGPTSSIKAKKTLTEFEVVGSAHFKGKQFPDIHKKTFYDKQEMIDQLPRFEMDLFDKAKVALNGVATETFDDQLKSMGYE